MKKLMIAAVACMALAGPANAGDWDDYWGAGGQKDREMAQEKADRQARDEAYMSALRHVDGTKLGKEYNRQAVQILRGKRERTYGFVKLEKAYDAAVRNRTDSNIANSGNWNNAYGRGNNQNNSSSDNQKSGAGMATGNGSGASTPDYR